MISALAWVRKGAAAEKPTTYEMTEEEYAKLQSVAAAEISDAKKELKKKSKFDEEILNDPALKDFDLENYDTEEEEEEEDDNEEDEGKQETNLFSNIKGLAYYDDNEEDPYITLKDGEAIEEDEEDEVQIFGTDNMLLVAKTEDDISNIEVCVFEGENDNLFVHHDFMLPAFPLAVEWLDYKVGRKAEQPGGGNYVAVATFEPRIEIWDLDTMDSMYPDLVLGTSDKKALRKAKGKPYSDFHTDAIMSLSWNKNVRNLLASSSADTTVKLWDLSAAKCVHSYNHHKDKVQSVQWHPSEASVMLTGGYDKRVGAFDSRASGAISWWAVDADVESVMWDIHSPSHFYVATEAGTVRYFDVRNVSNGKGDAPIYTLVAHDEAVSAMDQHPTIRGMIVTGSADETVKVWDVRENKPSMVISRNLDVGSVFAAKFCPDEPMLMAVGGSSGESRIWDISSNADVRATFGNAAKLGATPAKEKPLVGLQKDADDDEDRDAIISEMYGSAATDNTKIMQDDDDASMASDDE
ncbi:rRNA-processing protein [Coemansia spiralis]|uniref:rRNA-processing protein n=2 Tax=Coemansia TaxID=4863 RepID=A0A9W8L0C0_9FUNG|nr:WD40-repeat-containing domain protein [Coemansia spiralis]KAJ1994801.1 rRNA-processing protein [Coemansia umbellata]KAJ2624497.1 rRNA-processing protein [Coemansia sp. RSA 1358]KAJ2679538.1 rRNA-processing protein [Coemansia spiralis]